MEHEKGHKHSIVTEIVSSFIEWGHKYLTLSHWLFKGDQKIFVKVEVMMLMMTLFCGVLLFTAHLVPAKIAVILGLILIQRIVEFVIVYSRNFIFNRGRVFSHFKNEAQRGEWLLLMFGLNVAQLVLIFSYWYRLVSIQNPGAFSHQLTILESLYLSVITFLTIGYGDIVPISDLARLIVMVQGGLTFFTIVIVINGLISLHFIKKR